MDLTLLSLNIKVFGFEFSVSVCLSLCLCLSVSMSLTHCLSRLCFSSPNFSVNIKPLFLFLVSNVICADICLRITFRQNLDGFV